MSRGSITRRGKTSWRLKFDVPENGERRTRYITIKGKRQDAERELTRVLNEVDRGTLVDPNKISLGDYLASWLDGKDLTPRSREQYLDIIERQINPVLGKIELQKLKPLDVKQWLSGLRARDGRKLHARTLRHSYRVLHGALAEAVKLDLISRNVAAAVSPPKVEAAEVERY
jgi:integrase-like protein